jgi:carboxypeptidase C (cathepsin A)
MDEAAAEFLTFMDNLFVKYPEFVDRPLYMTGESYGGKYLPAFSKKLLEANAERGTSAFNLMATLIGDPYTAPLTQRTNIYKVPEALFTLDDMNLSQVSALNRHC